MPSILRGPQLLDGIDDSAWHRCQAPNADYECKHCSEREYIFRHGGGIKISKEENVPFLGEIPIDSEVVVGGDDGRPVIIQSPEAPASAAFRRVTARLKEEMARLDGQKPGDLSLTWR